MSIEKKKLENNFGKSIIFQENLSKYNWFNLGGPAEILFKPVDLDQLKNFLQQLNGSQKIICLGAGSNTLVRDGGFSGVIIKLSPKFSYINKLNTNILEVGAATLDKTFSRYCIENGIKGFEFLSCIPGSIGGAIRMNSGCYGDEISKNLLSVKVIDYGANISEIKKDDIKFFYRGSSLPENLIIVSANFKAQEGNKSSIQEKIDKYILQKKMSQPSQIKTCGSTFKNTDKKKAWELIKSSECDTKSFGQASMSKKHCNFFVNNGGATADDIEKLINYVKKKVFEKHKVNLDLEIKIIGDKKIDEK